MNESLSQSDSGLKGQKTQYGICTDKEATGEIKWTLLQLFSNEVSEPGLKTQCLHSRPTFLLSPSSSFWKDLDFCLSHYLNLCNSFNPEVHTSFFAYLKHICSCQVCQTLVNTRPVYEIPLFYLSSLNSFNLYMLHSSFLSVSNSILDSTPSSPLRLY